MSPYLAALLLGYKAKEREYERERTENRGIE